MFNHIHRDTHIREQTRKMDDIIESAIFARAESSFAKKMHLKREKKTSTQSIINKRISGRSRF